MNAKPQLVVVGVDGSDESIEALRWAAGYAKSSGATVCAIKSWHYPWAMQTAPQQIDVTVEQQIKGELDEAISKSAVDVQVEPSVLEGHASLVLVNASKRPDLLVVGSRGHGAFHGMLVGSVTQHCVTSSFCPVVVVRPSRRVARAFRNPLKTTSGTRPWSDGLDRVARRVVGLRTGAEQEH